jgi:hypothetical protein
LHQADAYRTTNPHGKTNLCRNLFNLKTTFKAILATLERIF